VNSSGAFRWSIAGVLLLTIGWKIAIQPDDPNYLKEDLIKFFERNHFNVVVTDEMVNDTPIIRATKASCHLQVARLTPMDRTVISFDILLQAQIARSSSFAARCTPNSQSY
jgi:hypothetical protein